MPTIPVDTSSLALWVHECTPKFISDVDQAVDAYEDLCRADIMRADDDIVRSVPPVTLELIDSGKRAHRLLLMLSTLPSEEHSWLFPRPSQGTSIPRRTSVWADV